MRFFMRRHVPQLMTTRLYLRQYATQPPKSAGCSQLGLKRHCQYTSETHFVEDDGTPIILVPLSKKHSQRLLWQIVAIVTIFDLIILTTLSLIEFFGNATGKNDDNDKITCILPPPDVSEDSNTVQWLERKKREEEA